MMFTAIKDEMKVRRLRREKAREFDLYIRNIMAAALKSCQADAFSLEQLTSYVVDKMEYDLKNRINAMLAIGTDYGLVRKNGNRFTVQGSISSIENALNKWTDRNRFTARRTCTCKPLRGPKW
nr:uncharacterized protein LOC106683727 isoform X2 [Halyomorpha halys]